jgi:hypothetical protein
MAWLQRALRVAGAGTTGQKSHKQLPFTMRGLLRSGALLFAMLIYKQDGDAQPCASDTFRLLPGSHELNVG